MTPKFEREVIFPAAPYPAALTFIAVLAYPEAGAGLPGGVGAEFAAALQKFPLWACSKSQGLAYLRERRGDPNYVAPKKREFQGTFDRGLRRVARRIAAYDVVGTQLVNGLLSSRRSGARAIKEGRTEDAFKVNPDGGPSPMRQDWLKASMRSPRQIIAGSEPRWSKKFGSNVTGAPADPPQKARDLYKRGFLPSRPVLHMVHALNECAYKFGPQIPRWRERDPVLAMLLNCELWIWEALTIAERWRWLCQYDLGLGMRPDDMIAVISPRGADTAFDPKPPTSATTLLAIP